jgi:hypothetical protein
MYGPVYTKIFTPQMLLLVAKAREIFEPRLLRTTSSSPDGAFSRPGNGRDGAWNKTPPPARPLEKERGGLMARSAGYDALDPWFETRHWILFFVLLSVGHGYKAGVRQEPSSFMLHASPFKYEK